MIVIPDTKEVTLTRMVFGLNCLQSVPLISKVESEFVQTKLFPVDRSGPHKLLESA